MEEGKEPVTRLLPAISLDKIYTPFIASDRACATVEYRSQLVLKVRMCGVGKTVNYPRQDCLRLNLQSTSMCSLELPHIFEITTPSLSSIPLKQQDCR